MRVARSQGSQGSQGSPMVWSGGDDGGTDEIAVETEKGGGRVLGLGSRLVGDKDRDGEIIRRRGVRRNKGLCSRGKEVDIRVWDERGRASCRSREADGGRGRSRARARARARADERV